MSFSVLFIVQKVNYVGDFIFPQRDPASELARLTISARSFDEIKTHINNLQVKYANQNAEIKVRVVHGAPPKKLRSWLKSNKDSLYLRAPTIEEEAAI